MCKAFKVGKDMEEAKEYELLATPLHTPFPFDKQLVGEQVNFAMGWETLNLDTHNLQSWKHIKAY